MKTVKLAQREKTNKMLTDFFANNLTLDIVACCKELGNAVFWNVPYQIDESDDSTMKLFVLWDQSENAEYKGNPFSTNEFPNVVFSTKYNVISKGNRFDLGPISFNTGGGFRHFIYFNVFGHSYDEEHIQLVRKTLEDYSNIK